MDLRKVTRQMFRFCGPPDETKFFRPDLLVNEDGVRLLAQGVQQWAFAWSDLDRVLGLKEDCYLNDCVWLELRYGSRGEVGEIHEGCRGFWTLLEALSQRLLGFPDDAWGRLVSPAFATNFQVLWDRDTANTFARLLRENETPEESSSPTFRLIDQLLRARDLRPRWSHEALATFRKDLHDEVGLELAPIAEPSGPWLSARGVEGLRLVVHSERMLAFFSDGRESKAAETMRALAQTVVNAHGIEMGVYDRLDERSFDLAPALRAELLDASVSPDARKSKRISLRDLIAESPRG